MTGAPPAAAREVEGGSVGDGREPMSPPPPKGKVKIGFWMVAASGEEYAGE